MKQKMGMARQHKSPTSDNGYYVNRWGSRLAAMFSRHRRGVNGVTHSTEKSARGPMTPREISPSDFAFRRWPSGPVAEWPAETVEALFEELEAEYVRARR